MGWTGALGWPPREPLLTGLAAVVTAALGIAIGSLAGTLHPFAVGVHALFFLIAAVNLALGMPRTSLACGFVALGILAESAEAPPVLGDVLGSAWLWLFLIAGLTVLFQAIRRGTIERRVRELSGEDGAGT